MDLSQFHLLKEADDHYMIGHPKGKSMRIDKKGMSSKAHEAIKKMSRGGAAHYDDGGEVSQEDIIPDRSPAAVTDPTPSAPDLSLIGQMPTSSELAQNNDLLPGQAPQAGSPDVPAAIAASPDQPPAAPAASNPTDLMKGAGVEAALRQEQKYRGQEAAGLENQSKMEAAALADTQKQIATMPTPQDLVNQYKAKDDALTQAFMDKKIDPSHLFKNMSTGSKLTAGIALFLGGLGAGLTGGQNVVAQQMKNLIDNDIEAQKSDQSKAMNAWKMNREALGNDLAAKAATQNQMYTALKYKVQQAAAESNSPIIAARAGMANAAIEQQIQQNRHQQALIQTGMGTATQQGGYSGDDPSILVPQLIKEPGMQKAAFDEIKNAQNITKNGPLMLQAFDDAANKIHAVDFVPGIENKDQKALHQLMLPNFKGIDGTVRQAAMDESFHNLTPQFGDSKATVEAKRAALKEWMSSESAAPTAKGHGIDLSKFRSTAASSIQGGDEKTVGGVKYTKVPGGWKRMGG